MRALPKCNLFLFLIKEIMYHEQVRILEYRHERRETMKCAAIFSLCRSYGEVDMHIPKPQLQPAEGGLRGHYETIFDHVGLLERDVLSSPSRR